MSAIATSKALDTRPYALAAGEEPFDWNTFLNEPHHSTKEWGRAFYLAAHWPTCAVGNQCAALPRYDGGEPLDRALTTLGNAFYEALTTNKISEAKELMGKIEARSAELLHQLSLPALPLTSDHA